MKTSLKNPRVHEYLVDKDGELIDRGVISGIGESAAMEIAEGLFSDPQLERRDALVGAEYKCSAKEGVCTISIV